MDLRATTSAPATASAHFAERVSPYLTTVRVSGGTADAGDLKSPGGFPPCGFDSRLAQSNCAQCFAGFREIRLEA